jgi:serine-type D-Ala-D-Ala carboxypeptidase/endopeptidase (penicillin-binding protein 4)
VAGNRHGRVKAARSTSRIALAAIAALVIAAGIALAAYAATAGGLGRYVATSSLNGTGAHATVPPTPSAVASALLAPSSAPAADPPAPTPAQIAAALAGPLADPALGSQVLAQVTDAETGAVLYSKSATGTAAPASTAKIATAAATLATHASSQRITTSVVAGASPGQVVLVGAGDPTLSGAAPGAATPYAGAARISDLAAQLKTAGVVASQVVVDGGLFIGPATAPAWAANDTPTDYASPITAVMADGGRDNPTAAIRSASPDLGAGIELAADLGLPATKVTRGGAPAGAKQLASVQSATYGQLVDEMLLESDNVIAECLARQVAIAAKAPVSFAGAAAAIRATLSPLGADIGAGLTDGSGLAASDRISPLALVGLLRLATQRADLRAVLDDLPVAGWDGTLSDRFGAGSPAQAGAGLVRAKTGTLTSVSTLAGVATTSQGRLLLFAFMAPKVGPTTADTDAAETALDTAAAALVG